MIHDSALVDFTRLESHDVVIVGAGAVGIIAAVDLCHRGLRVLLLEAGSAFIDAESQRFFELAESTGKRHRGLYEGRFRALGGTTNFWGGQLVRFDPSIFEDRPWISEFSAWPFGIDELEPYYRKCENLLSIPECLRFDENVFDLARVPEERHDDHLQYFFTRWLTEKNFRVRFLRDLRHLKGLTVITNAPVIGLASDAADGAVTGLRIRKNDGFVEDVSAPSVVLANGTIEIARLLQFPLTNGRRPAWADNPWLGRGFMDHLEGPIGYLTPRDRTLLHKLFDNLFIKGMKLQPRMRVKRRTQVQQGLLDFAIHVKFESFNIEDFENAKIFIAGLLRGRIGAPLAKLPSHLFSTIKVGVPMVWHYLVNRRIFTPRGAMLSLRIMIEQRQIRQSTVTLKDELDPLGMHIVRLNWQVDSDKELATARAAALMAKEYFETNGLADVSIDDDLVNGNQNWITRSIDTFHHMGTTRLASSAENGVVDPDCRVFGTTNLYVAGASVFPSAGFANPTFTAMALTLRLCDTLVDKRHGE